jgi:hypothetical protein
MAQMLKQNHFSNDGYDCLPCKNIYRPDPDIAGLGVRMIWEIKNNSLTLCADFHIISCAHLRLHSLGYGHHSNCLW